MFVDVRGCSLVVVGVPVKIRRMTWRENLNLGRCFFSPAERRCHGRIEREQRKFCPFLSNDGDRSKTVLLPVLLSSYGGRFGSLSIFC